MIPIDYLPNHPLDAAILEKIAICNLSCCYVVKLVVLRVFITSVWSHLDVFRGCVYHHLATCS